MRANYNGTDLAPTRFALLDGIRRSIKKCRGKGYPRHMGMAPVYEQRARTTNNSIWIDPRLDR